LAFAVLRNLRLRNQGVPGRTERSGSWRRSTASGRSSAALIAGAGVSRTCRAGPPVRLLDEHPVRQRGRVGPQGGRLDVDRAGLVAPQGVGEGELEVAEAQRRIALPLFCAVPQALDQEAAQALELEAKDDRLRVGVARIRSKRCGSWKGLKSSVEFARDVDVDLAKRCSGASGISAVLRDVPRAGSAPSIAGAQRSNRRRAIARSRAGG